MPLAVAAGVILLVVSATGFYFWASSAGVEDLVRMRLVRHLEAATGGRVEIGSFHWHLLSLEADAEGLVIHGKEAVGEAPYARVERLAVKLSVLNFMSPRILLRDLEIYRPSVHLVVYRDGSTNQPQPKRAAGNLSLDTIFRARAWGGLPWSRGFWRTRSAAPIQPFRAANCRSRSRPGELRR